ncbi:hypothetical protein LTR22_019955 [Elasticomyces elasticus]|nr:hypothetical protein LTR22_019955 [Elasticomyces elasticus]
MTFHSLPAASSGSTDSGRADAAGLMLAFVKPERSRDTTTTCSWRSTDILFTTLAGLCGDFEQQAQSHAVRTVARSTLEQTYLLRPTISISLTLTATGTPQLLQDGSLTSETLLDLYLSQVDKHNHTGLHLNALISVTPRHVFFERAHSLGPERYAGHVHSALHGIPVVVKDVFVTHPDLGMPTTVASPCFAIAKTKRNAVLVQYLLDLGMILLDEGNLTEFCGLKMRGHTVGYSPMGEQAQSPYIFGSAVAARSTSLAVETEGLRLVISPADRAGLYALKCGLGEVVEDRAFNYANCTGYIGGMAKSGADISTFVVAMMQKQTSFGLGVRIGGLRLGFTNAEEWKLPEELCAWRGNTSQKMVISGRLMASSVVVTD